MQSETFNNTLKQQQKKKFRQGQLITKQKWKQSGIKISKDVRDIIHGYVLSDGYIRKGVLTIDQSLKQKRFVMWLYNKLQPVRTSSLIQEVSRIHPTTKRNSLSLRFFTRSFLKGFQHMWYKPFVNKKGFLTYKKQLPKSFNCLFNEMLISVWYAGDGTKTVGSLGAKFEVSSFTVEERLTLKQLFWTKFGIQARIISSGVSKKGNKLWALKIPPKDYSKFYFLITKTDLIVKVFPYKLHKKP
jgi:hypothetical protein